MSMDDDLKIYILFVSNELYRSRKYEDYRFIKREVHNSVKKELKNLSDDKKLKLLEDANIDRQKNYNFWSKSKTWQVSEIVTIIIGLDPLLIKDFIAKHQWTYGLSSQLSYEKCIEEFYGNKIYREYKSLLHLLSGHFPYGYVEPIEFIEWAQCFETHCPQGLVDGVLRFKNVPNWKKEYEKERAEKEILKAKCSVLEGKYRSLSLRSNTSDKIISTFIKGCDNSSLFQNKRSAISRAQSLLELGGRHFDDKPLRERLENGTKLLGDS